MFFIRVSFANISCSLRIAFWFSRQLPWNCPHFGIGDSASSFCTEPHKLRSQPCHLGLRTAIHSATAQALSLGRDFAGGFWLVLSPVTVVCLLEGHGGQKSPPLAVPNRRSLLRGHSPCSHMHPALALLAFRCAHADRCLAIPHLFFLFHSGR